MNRHVESGPSDSPGAPGAMRNDARGSVRLVDIRKRFGDLHAVAGIDLDVRAGEFVSILGPSGSGKTTTMRIIGGFERPDEGRVEFGGADVTAVPPHRRDVNTVFQSYALFPHMTVQRNVEYGLKIKGVSRAERRVRATEALALVRLTNAAPRRPHELSGGMSQRVALARALVNRPAVLLLDEPLGALDRKLREDMQIELRQIQRDVGTTFIYITHDQEEALAMSDRVVVMRDGRIEQVGTPADVYDNPATLWISGFVGASNHMSGTARRVGERVEVDVDFGPVRACHVHGAIATGDRVTVAVRPEHVRITAAGAREGSGKESGDNVVLARIEEALNVGASLRCVAETANGARVMALLQRAAFDAQIAMGDDVHLSWPARAAHVYRSADGRRDP